MSELPDYKKISFPDMPPIPLVEEVPDASPEVTSASGHNGSHGGGRGEVEGEGVERERRGRRRGVERERRGRTKMWWAALSR